MVAAGTMTKIYGDHLGQTRLQNNLIAIFGDLGHHQSSIVSVISKVIKSNHPNPTITSTQSTTLNCYQNMKIQLLSRVLLFSQLSTMVSSHTRIIGGEKAEAGKFPYAVSFQDTSGHFCGGSLISRDVVLSAA